MDTYVGSARYPLVVSGLGFARCYVRHTLRLMTIRTVVLEDA